MSYEEKGQWVYLIVGVLTLGGYLMIVGGQARKCRSQTSITSRRCMTIGIAIGLSIARTDPPGDRPVKDTFKEDERDRDINRMEPRSAGSCSAWA